MDKESVIKEIIARKRTIDGLIHEEYHEIARKYGLSLDQFHLLIELEELTICLPDEEKTPTVGELAKSFSSTQNTMSERISRLEERGLVVRTRDAGDRRISHVHMTREGDELVASIGSEMDKSFVSNSLGKVGFGDLCRMNEILGRIRSIMKDEVMKGETGNDGF